jgi:hypothetical protein
LTEAIILDVLAFLVKAALSSTPNAAGAAPEALRLLQRIDDERKALAEGLAANREAAAAVIAERKKNEP